MEFADDKEQRNRQLQATMLRDQSVGNNDFAQLLKRYNPELANEAVRRDQMTHYPQKTVSNPVGDGLSALFKAASQNLQRPFSPEGRQQLADSVTSQFANPEAGLDFVAPMGGMVGAIKAFHGSPHKFNKFDMSKLGTGEGAQAYGNGLYFADNIDVAKGYSEMVNMPKVTAINKELKRLSGVMDSDAKYAGAYRQFKSDVGEKAAKEYDILMDSKLKPDPQLYETSLRWPDAAREAADPMSVKHFLDFDKPMSEQSNNIKSAAVAYEKKRLQDNIDSVNKSKKYYEYKGQSTAGDDSELASLKRKMEKYNFDTSFKDDYLTGREYYKEYLSQENDALKTEYLKSLGVPGIRYLDGNSRGAGAGSSNYVVFDDAIPEITKRNGEPLGMLGTIKAKN